MKSHGSFSIGQLSAATGVKVVTIRYYEGCGLIPKPRRTDGNYRAYGHNDVRHLKFVRRCRDLGFTLQQVRELLQLSMKYDRDCGEVDRIVSGHLTQIERKIADLKKLATELNRIGKRCCGAGRVADCRTLQALSPKN